MGGRVQTERWIGVLAAGSGLLLHLALGYWLMQPHLELKAPAPRLEIHLLTSLPPLPPPPPPPFPSAPARRIATPPRPSSSATPASRPAPAAAEAESTAPLAPLPDATQLLDSARSIVWQQAQSAVPSQPNPMRRTAPRLPGRSQPFTPTAIVLRKPLAPQDVVKWIGKLFGANYQPCPDTQRQIDALVARNRPVEEAELRRLIDRERRLGCQR